MGFLMIRFVPDDPDTQNFIVLLGIWMLLLLLLLLFRIPPHTGVAYGKVQYASIAILL